MHTQGHWRGTHTSSLCVVVSWNSLGNEFIAGKPRKDTRFKGRLAADISEAVFSDGLEKGKSQFPLTAKGLEQGVSHSIPINRIIADSRYSIWC